LILIVDDDQAITQLLSDIFSIEGYRILHTGWGHEAISLVKEHHPDLIIMDMFLPDLNGIEITERIRLERGIAYTPIIFVSESTDRDNRLRVFSMGVEDYVAKPFNIEELLLRVRNVLERTKNSAQNNPSTGLPEGELLNQILDNCLKKKDRIVLLITIIHFDMIRQKLGGLACQFMIRQLVLQLENTLRSHGDSNSTLGQLASNQFVLMLPASFSDQEVDKLDTTLHETITAQQAQTSTDISDIPLDIDLKQILLADKKVTHHQDIRELADPTDFGAA
jgi:DNA-binding response OmpR family regulator